jgi:hypothetical protein
MKTRKLFSDEMFEIWQVGWYKQVWILDGNKKYFLDMALTSWGVGRIIKKYLQIAAVCSN